ncbi:MAG TPA: hypothetical protein VF499_00690 [Afipia sp.]
MKKLVNRVDHVAWIVRYENVDTEVARLEELADVKLQRFERSDAGILICVNWDAGLEILSPLPERNDFNGALHDHLDRQGQGVFAVVFGVSSLDRQKQRLEALGYEVGPEVDDHPDSPWHDRLVLRERIAGPFLGGFFTLGDIAYADDVIRIEDV